MDVLAEMPAAGAGAAIRASLRRSRPGTLPETTLVVRDVRGTAAHLAEYDRVCGFRLTDAIPATYPHVLAFPLAMRLMTDRQFPFPVIGTVHIGNAITQTRPIALDEAMTLSVHATDLRPHDRGQQFDLITTASVDGAEVWRDVSTYLRRSRSSGSGGGNRSAEPAAARPEPSAYWKVGRQVGTAYAAASGDHNPIHTSRLGARALGFPAPIAHGMWTMARALAGLEGRLPAAYTVAVAFKRPIRLGSTVAFRAVRIDGGWSLDVSDPKSGAPHLTGTVTE
jgi:acyl dehydratase